MSDVIEIEAEVNESVGGTGGVAGYHYLPDKPSINGVTLVDNKSAASLGLVDDVQQDGESVVDGSVANLTPFSGGSTSSASNKAGLVPKPPTIEETGQWHILTDNGWKEATPQPDSSIPWATKYSPTFSGTPKAPTAAVGTNTTQIATTAFVHDEILEVPKVYCGEEAPEDPNAMVWVDTNGDPYPMEEEIAEAVDAWIDAHPEAVTTIQDGAVSKPKLDNNLKSKIDLVDTNATHIANLDALVNNLATLQEGSTTGDAELIAARTVGSTTYQNLHTAIDTEFTNVKSDSINKMDGIMSDAQTANLIIADAIRYGEYYDANGKVATAGTWWRTSLIPASPSTSYSAGGCRTLFFESDGTYISDNSSWSGTTFTTPANTAYIAVCSNAAYTSAYLYLTAKTPASWVKGDRLITIAKIKDFAKEVGEKGAQFFPKFTSGKNLIDVSGAYMTVVPDYYYAYNTGIKTYVAGMNYVVFPVEVGTKYVVNADNIHVAFFNSDTLSSATYVSGFLSSAGNGYTWTVPNGAFYMTVSFGNSKKPTLQLEYGSTSTPYEPFEWGMNGNSILKKSIDFSKLTEALQGSIGNAVTIGTNGDYTSILEAMIACGENTTFYVLAGTYDIESEYTAKYGASYFSNYNGYAGTGNVFDAGLYLKKGCKLIGLGEVNLVFNYSGSNSKVKTYFAPLNTTSDNVVDNINISIASDSCRYIIHDDFASSNGTNMFRNLVLEGDSHLKTVMGCGMGTANTYIIENCFIDSGDDSDGISIAYHNNVASGAKNKLVIKDCYCNRGIRGGMYGASTAKSKMIVSGCKASSITCILTDPDNYTNQNIELVAWNNETN